MASPSIGRAARLVARALRLRCPNCGQGHLLATWFRMHERCPVCRVWLEREEGYFVGAMAINLVVAELLPVAAAVVVLVTTWPNPPWLGIQIGLPIGMGVLPVVLFPFSRCLWLALDWTFNPPTREPQPEQARP
jgi:uncharacterized protein (DUF983 family)